MYRLKISDYFSSAHQLRGYRGKCEDLHGHNWKVDVAVEGLQLDEVGLLVDFKHLKDMLQSVLDELDHTFLNKLEPFRDQNPSSENVARYIFGKMSTLVPDGITVASVTVWESDKACAEYCE